MAGDPLRDAFRALLSTVKTEKSIAWATKDTLNTDDNPDAGAPYLELAFDGGGEKQGTFGSPGNNLHDEEGQVRLNIYMPLGAEQAQGEVYARALRNGFRSRQFQTSEGRDVLIDAVTPMGGGETAGGMWVETIVLSYQTTNLG
jgi:hypothetical protein